MRLADWQSAFIKALAPQGDATELTALVNQDEQARLSIYHNNAFQALLAALQSVFPVCQTVVGEACFTQLVKSYCQYYPLNDLNLNHYGCHFSTWLAKETANYEAFIDLSYLSELAQLEWLLNQSYYAMDRGDFLRRPHHDLSALASLNEAQQLQVILLLSPDVALLSCHYPVQQVWNKYQVPNERSVPESVQVASNEQPTPYHLVIYRQHYKAQYRCVEQAEMALLQAISSEHTLAEITGSAVDLSLLAALIERQWVCGFKLSAVEGSGADG